MLGVANAFTLVEEYAQDLNLTVSFQSVACAWSTQQVEEGA